MVYVVERYLPGLDQRTLVPLLGKLGRATQELRTEGTHVRYLGSTIVPGDEACFCQFEGASEAAVAEANERAGVPFDRIVAADLTTRTTRVWSQPGSYPGEPVFVPAPGAEEENEGVLLSVVLDAGAGTSFLLVLDAATLEERARARVPHHIPFGFHGQFAPA